MFAQVFSRVDDGNPYSELAEGEYAGSGYYRDLYRYYGCPPHWTSG
jgi:hypothetical protein